MLQNSILGLFFTTLLQISKHEQKAVLNLTYVLQKKKTRYKNSSGVERMKAKEDNEEYNHILDSALSWKGSQR